MNKRTSMLLLALLFCGVTHADVIVVCPDPGVVSTNHALGVAAPAGVPLCLNPADGSVVDWVVQDTQESWMPVLSESDGYEIAASILGLWVFAYALVQIRRAVLKR